MSNGKNTTIKGMLTKDKDGIVSLFRQREVAYDGHSWKSNMGGLFCLLGLGVDDILKEYEISYEITPRLNKADIEDIEAESALPVKIRERDNVYWVLRVAGQEMYLYCRLDLTYTEDINRASRFFTQSEAEEFADQDQLPDMEAEVIRI